MDAYQIGFNLADVVNEIFSIRLEMFDNSEDKDDFMNGFLDNLDNIQ